MTKRNISRSSQSNKYGIPGDRINFNRFWLFSCDQPPLRWTSFWTYLVLPCLWEPVSRLVHGTHLSVPSHGNLWLSHPMGFLRNYTNTEYILSCACLMSNLYRAVSETPRNFQSWDRKLGDPFLVSPQNVPAILFSEARITTPGTGPPREIFTMLWAYNDGIQLQKIPAYDVKLQNYSNPTFYPKIQIAQVFHEQACRRLL